MPMRTIDTAAVIDRVVARLIERYEPRQVILFGSCATGRADESSDIDLLIVKHGAEGDRFKRSETIDRLTRDVRGGHFLDSHVRTPEELQNSLRRGNHFHQDIVDHGVYLHGERIHYVEDENPDFWKGMLRDAEKDWWRLELMKQHEDWEGVARFLQEALEKYFKAWLIRRGWRLVRTHKVQELAAEAHQRGMLFSIDPGILTRITRYYFDTRYPGDPANPDPDRMTPEQIIKNVQHDLPAVMPLIEQLREDLREE